MSMFLFVGMAATSNVASADAQWTFMVYLDGDNNLESAGIDDFLEMSSVGSDSNVKIVVQFDRIDGYDSSYGDWKTCKRFYVTSDMTPTAGNAIADIGEANMGDPATLTAFINWARTNYPANRYALVLWNHGGGWREQQEALIKALEAAKTCEGKNEIERALKEIRRPNYKAVCWDDTDGGDCLYMKEVKSALNAATGDMHMIGFDACFMGMIEVAYEIKGTGASVVVGSEETEPGDGWPYNTILSDLLSHPSWISAQLGTAIVDRYYASYGNSETQSAIDLTQMNNLASTVSNFADKMRTSWNTDKSAVQTAAQAVMDGIDTAVIHDQHGSSWPSAHGLAIYFPDNSGDFDSDYNGTVIDFPADTLWEEFLSDFYASMGGSWIELARWNSQEFYYPEHIDLYDFCENIVNSPTGDLVLSEGFEGGAVPPGGWTLDVTNPGYTWGIHTYDPHSGTYAADVLYDPALTPQDEVLLTPELPAMTSATLEFWSFGSIYWGITPYDNYDLEVWIVVGDWDAGAGDDIFLAKADDDWVNNWVWSLTSIDLSSYLPAAQPVRIGFRYKGVDGAQAALDDIKIWDITKKAKLPFVPLLLLGD